MKPMFAVMFLLFAPSLFAQQSRPHSGLKTSEAMGTAADSRPAKVAVEDTTPTQIENSTSTGPAPVYEPSTDHTTTDEVDALAAKLRKQREAREKAKKEKEAK